MKTIAQLKNEKAAKLKPEDIDFGYCMPDCGSCCPSGQWMLLYTDGIAQHLGISGKSITDEFEKQDFGSPCIFLYSHSVCLIHDYPPRQMMCGWFGCEEYRMIESLSEIDIDEAGVLKNAWLRALKENYNQDAWLSAARQHVRKTYEEIFRKRQWVKK
jgi:Fe-S-cluster containining protein